MKYCSECGTKINADSNICSDCNCKIKVPNNSPVGKLKTNRSLFKFIFLSIITFGIYSIVVLSSVSTDIDIIASRYDGKKTMPYCLLLFIFSWLTLGIATFVWNHKISNRIGMELTRRNIPYDFNASMFWIFNILGALIVIGPFIYVHKMLKAMNLLAKDYNING